MIFKPAKSINGTSLQGYIRASFRNLVHVFGRPQVGPHDYDADKITCCWELEFEDGVIATIYDWKTGETPLTEYDWHVGGRSTAAVDRVNQLFAANTSNLTKTYRVNYTYQIQGHVDVSAHSQEEADELALQASIDNRRNERYVSGTFETIIKEIV